MSKAPENGRLSREDFPGQADWIDKLLTPIGSFFLSTTAAFRRLTRFENFDSQVEEFVLTTPGTVAEAFPYKFEVKMARRPSLLWVASIENLTTEAATFTTAVFPSWQLTGSQVKINHLTGLAVSTKYRVRVVLE